MKGAWYAVLLVGMVPAQTTILSGWKVVGVGPDYCLVVACLIGFFAGELEGLVVGMAIGLMQDLFSAGDQWVNYLTKAFAGLIAGLVGKHLAGTTTGLVVVTTAVLSFLSCAVFAAITGAKRGLLEALLSFKAVAPEVLLNTVLAFALFSIVSRYVRPFYETRGEFGDLAP
jgi:cell shape-determining protein MreD